MGRRRSPWTIELAKELVEILKVRESALTPDIYREVREKTRGKFVNNKVNYSKVYRTLMALYNAGFIDRKSVNGKVSWSLRERDVKPEDITRALLGVF